MRQSGGPGAADLGVSQSAVYKWLSRYHHHGLRHLSTRSYRPQTNGKAELFIQTMLNEWAYRIPDRSSRARTRWLPRSLHFYNHHRMYQSLGNLSPISRLSRLNNIMRMHT